MWIAKQILAFFFCFIRELNHILPSYLLPHSARELKTHPRELKPFTPPLPSHSAYPPTHPSAHP